jgi:hypothetical protein
VIRQLLRIWKDKGILFVCMKEGDGEGMITDKEDGTTQRYFAFYRQDELIEIFKNMFEPIEIGHAIKENTTFLQVFFRKK